MADHRGYHRNHHKQYHKCNKQKVVSLKLCCICVVCSAIDQMDVVDIQLKLAHVESLNTLKYIWKLLVNHWHEEWLDGVKVCLLAHSWHAKANAQRVRETFLGVHCDQHVVLVIQRLTLVKAAEVIVVLTTVAVNLVDGLSVCDERVSELLKERDAVLFNILFRLTGLFSHDYLVI
jgi:hypothetical protein